jgi:hypothetical protein
LNQHFFIFDTKLFNNYFQLIFQRIMSKFKQKTTKYQASYELIYPWVARDPKTDTNALCTWCKTVINISSMGKSALHSHVKSIKHKNIVATKEKSIQMEMFVQCKEKDSAQSAITDAESLQGTLIIIIYSVITFNNACL